MKAPATLETARLCFRRPTLADAQTVFKLYSRDPTVTQYLSWKTHEKLDDTLAFLKWCQQAWEEGSVFPYALLLKETQQFIGMIELRPEHTRVSLGYVLAQMFWGKGYATEAVTALMNWALDQPGIHRVWAVCDLENLASRRVLEKAGLHCEGILRRWEVLPNLGAVPRDCYCYAKVRE